MVIQVYTVRIFEGILIKRCSPDRGRHYGSQGTWLINIHKGELQECKATCLNEVCCDSEMKVVISESHERKIRLDDFDKQFIRRKVHDFQIVKKLPTIPMILDNIKPAIEISPKNVRKRCYMNWVSHTGNPRVCCHRKA